MGTVLIVYNYFGKNRSYTGCGKSPTTDLVKIRYIKMKKACN